MASPVESVVRAPAVSVSRSAANVFRAGAPLTVAVASLCAVAGLFTIYPMVRDLLMLWRTDDLRSMGLLAPFIAFALILRSWRQIGWRTDGSWWGFSLLVGTAALVFLHAHTLLMVIVRHAWLVDLPPKSLVAVLYSASVVLLFGGVRLLRQAWFGILFMALVIPIPHIFSQVVDLPLQHASAVVAQHFAQLFGHPLTLTDLGLMFTPTFGFFIAPGCNGIRGSVTLGLAALVVSYLYRFRWYIYLPVVAGAVLLGYLFNFLRLCLLVVYYVLALPYPWLQHRGRNADYVIGGTLFMLALLIFFTVANRLRNDLYDEDDLPVVANGTSLFPLLGKTLAVLSLAAIVGVNERQAQASSDRLAQISAATPSLPQQLGAYKLQRAWHSALPAGTVVYTWGSYAIPGDPGPAVALGVSPALNNHDTDMCHLARGEDPVFHGHLNTRSGAGTVDLKVATYNNGAVQWLEGSSICQSGACREFTGDSGDVTVTLGRPHMGQAGTRPVPVLLRVESADPSIPDAVERPLLQARLQAFLQSFDLVKVTRPYSALQTR